ncbi:MAG TPA: hypothetical protein VE197_00640 [Mycobacterium sp.]|nr:hypothetical protein [Mycobacterium sp.]
MNAMHVTVTDTTGTSGTVTAERSEVAAAIRPWFSDASPEVHAAIDRLQQSLDRAPADHLGTEDTDLSTTRLCAYLGIKLGLADADRQDMIEEAAIMGEAKPKPPPPGAKPIEGVAKAVAAMVVVVLAIAVWRGRVARAQSRRRAPRSTPERR